MGDDNSFKYFKFHIETIMDEEGNPVTDDAGKPKKKATIRNYIQNTQTGQISESLDATSYEIAGSLDVRVSTGSSLPFAKNDTANKAMKLYTIQQPPGGGVIDAEELLKSLEYPNYEIVLQRLNQQRAQQAAAAQAAQAQAPPPK